MYIMQQSNINNEHNHCFTTKIKKKKIKVEHCGLILVLVALITLLLGLYTYIVIH